MGNWIIFCRCSMRGEDLDVPLVIDHMARQDATRPLDEAAVRELERHLRKDNRWIKLSGVDRLMQGAAPPWTAALPLVRRLVQAAPERAIWGGTDWPRSQHQRRRARRQQPAFAFVQERPAVLKPPKLCWSITQQRLYF
ncbi:amidohydrolase family protein [Cupriavidus basilensis]